MSRSPSPVQQRSTLAFATGAVIIASFFIVMALAMLYTLTKHYQHQRMLQNQGSHVAATIDYIDKQFCGRFAHCYHAYYHAALPSGQVITDQVSLDHAIKTAPSELWYDPANPADHELESTFLSLADVLGVPLIMALIGVFAGFIGWNVWRSARSRNRQNH